MKKIKIILLVVIVLTVGGYAAANVFPSEEKKIEREFNKRLEQKITDGGGKIYLKDLVDFEWDKVCFLLILNKEILILK